MSHVKEEAINVLKKLPQEISWDDVIYEMYVKKKIDEGLKATNEGRLISHEDVKKRFLGK